MTVTIYHNPRCSKSRQTLAILEDRNVELMIIPYLDDAPSVEELTRILAMLDLEPRALMRKGEAAYKEQGLDDPALSREALIAAMVKTPILIERPIVINGDKAALGRPPEQVLTIL